jgi:uncharacterized membrane protein
MLQALARNFLRGVLFVVPIAVTVYVVYLVVVSVDGFINLEPLVGRRVPGAGLVLTLSLITFVGFLATNFMTRWLFGVMDRAFGRLPLIKLIYSSIKDLIDAFVGENKRFDKPVLVETGEGIGVALLGFLTREDLSEFGLPGRAAVYFPQSYNFAGNLFVVPRERLRPISVESARVMALIVSGGVSGEGAAAARGRPRD